MHHFLFSCFVESSWDQDLLVTECVILNILHLSSAQSDYLDLIQNDENNIDSVKKDINQPYLIILLCES